MEFLATILLVIGLVLLCIAYLGHKWLRRKGIDESFRIVAWYVTAVSLVVYLFFVVEI